MFRSELDIISYVRIRTGFLVRHYFRLIFYRTMWLNIKFILSLHMNVTKWINMTVPNGHSGAHIVEGIVRRHSILMYGLQW